MCKICDKYRKLSNATRTIGITLSYDDFINHVKDRKYKVIESNMLYISVGESITIHSNALKDSDIHIVGNRSYTPYFTSYKQIRVDSDILRVYDKNVNPFPALTLREIK